jgi:3-dehydroquinate synthetase
MLNPNLQTTYVSSLEEIKSLFGNNRSQRVIAIIDSMVAKHYGDFLPSQRIVVELTEENKIFSEVEKIASALLEMEADRETLIVIAGGGVLCDLGAFTASIYMRGLPFMLIPTTLLAMTDAAIGGKNGVNIGVYKNILGLFRRPQNIIVCHEFLKTLPEEEYRNGLAELLKTFIIGDRDSFLEVVPIMKNRNEIAPYISKAASIKTEIVERDPFDKGERRLLNLGHTFAHTFELTEGLPHGVAVATGIVLAAKLSQKLSFLPKAEQKMIEEGFNIAGFDVSSPVKMEPLIDIMYRDKKRSGDIINFVLIKKIGETMIHPIHLSDLKDILYDLS